MIVSSNTPRLVVFIIPYYQWYDGYVMANAVSKPLPIIGFV